MDGLALLYRSFINKLLNTSKLNEIGSALVFVVASGVLFDKLDVFKYYFINFFLNLNVSRIVKMLRANYVYICTYI